ncbi:hypothetical protein [Streptomyces sp. NBC_01500]|uniref:hypothetical protein n=1 Tax=Streptomyces sp. NBC_01500 TaxID=2903886 RepID=UPI0022540922|nr:hypothetical protein [Streptomyces sp. NBC_01500]MCX4549887.1 hypothetical protein [Streptomyces sp. NBC_01500]
MRHVPRALAAAVIPLAVIASSAADANATPSISSAPSAAFVLNTETGKFNGATETGPQERDGLSASVPSLQVLSRPGTGAVLAGMTLASSPTKQERAAWAANSHFVDLSWPDLGGAYEVYKNDRLVAATAGHSMRDTHVKPGSVIDYQITGKTGTWGLTVTVPKGSDAETLEATAAQAETQAKKYTKTAVVWRSFIRQKWAYVPGKYKKLSGCTYASGYKYAGDNRGFSSKVDGPSYRAKLKGVVYWTKSSYDLFPSTGKSRVYSTKTGKLVATKHASAKKIDFRTKTRFDGKTRAVHADIEATDPFCKYGGIGAFYDARLARNGDFYVSGKYKQAPDNEMYIYGYTSGTKHSTKTVHRSKMGSIKCLYKGACELGTLSNNGGY